MYYYYKNIIMHITFEHRQIFYESSIQKIQVLN